jgi:hypothetical protein
LFYLGQSNDCARLGGVDFVGVCGGGDCRKCYKIGGISVGSRLDKPSGSKWFMLVLSHIFDLIIRAMIKVKIFLIVEFKKEYRISGFR